MINEEYNNLPRDVIKSLAKMEKIIKIIETNLFLPKDDILREINIEIGSTQKAMDIFSQYYLHNPKKENYSAKSNKKPYKSNTNR